MENHEHEQKETPTTPTNSAMNPPATQQSINFAAMRDYIINNDILPSLKHDIDSNYRWRWRWNFLSRSTGALSQILTGVGSIFSFVATSNNNLTFAFMAGIFGVIALFMTNFSTYSDKEQKKKTTEINKYLEKINLKFSLPEQVVSTPEETQE